MRPNEVGFHIGVKQIKAHPKKKDGVDGYAVTYSDGYESWSPKEVFEKAYLPMGAESDGTKITQEMVDGFIRKIDVQTVGEKTTVVHVTLVNGFEIVESSSCVDKANYDENLGKDICMGRIKNRIWELLGFVLQSARHGIQR